MTHHLVTLFLLMAASASGQVARSCRATDLAAGTLMSQLVERIRWNIFWLDDHPFDGSRGPIRLRLVASESTAGFCSPAMLHCDLFKTAPSEGVLYLAQSYRIKSLEPYDSEILRPRSNPPPRKSPDLPASRKTASVGGNRIEDPVGTSSPPAGGAGALDTLRSVCDLDEATLGALCTAIYCRPTAAEICTQSDSRDRSTAAYSGRSHSCSAILFRRGRDNLRHGYTPPRHLRGAYRIPKGNGLVEF